MATDIAYNDSMITNIVMIVAATIFMEAAGESMEGKRAVASVIHNRSVKSSKSLDAICLAPKQFSCWNEGVDSALQKVRTRIAKSGTPDHRAWLECLEIANAMVGGKFVPTLVADHYFADWIGAPRWASAMTRVSKIGKHIFFQS
jgi:spore germination cell wall hydrolase CwlJ-like protein